MSSCAAAARVPVRSGPGRIDGPRRDPGPARRGGCAAGGQPAAAGLSRPPGSGRAGPPVRDPGPGRRPGRRRRGALRIRTGQKRDPAHPLRAGRPVPGPGVARPHLGLRRGHRRRRAARSAPRSSEPGDLAESGHGLRVVADLAAAWGHQELGPAGFPRPRRLVPPDLVPVITVQRTHRTSAMVCLRYLRGRAALVNASIIVGKMRLGRWQKWPANPSPRSTRASWTRTSWPGRGRISDYLNSHPEEDLIR